MEEIAILAYLKRGSSLKCRRFCKLPCFGYVESTMAALECGICAEPYDLSVRPALSLACGHSLCRVCLSETQRSGQLCPICCKPLYLSPSPISVNSTVQSALTGQAVYCPQHLTPVTSFCLVHMWVICKDCSHPGSAQCVVKDLNRHKKEVEKAISDEIGRISGLLKGGFLPVDVQKSVLSHYNASLTVNMHLLRRLYDIARSYNVAVQKTTSSSASSTAFCVQIPASPPILETPPALCSPPCFESSQSAHSPESSPRSKSQQCCQVF